MNDWVESQDSVMSLNMLYILCIWFFRVQKLHQRWVALRSLLHSKLITPLSSISFPVEERTVTRQTRTVLETRLVETNIHFRQLQECTEWCHKKLVSYCLVSAYILLLWIWLLINMYIPRILIESCTVLCQLTVIISIASSGFSSLCYLPSLQILWKFMEQQLPFSLMI
jgi:hypothetical protein